MNTTPITIDNAGVTIDPAGGTAWLTLHQIADLFGVFVSAAGSNIRAILKSEVLRENEVSRRRENGNGSFVTVYNLEMITALAFRLKSQQAQQYRRWIIRQALNPIILWKIPGFDTLLN